MELKNEFGVGVPVTEAWKVLTDVERIAPLLPGAQLQEVEGDEYRGVVKVKVGPITAQYKGMATFIEREESAGRVVLKASGRDTRGQGNASATITVNMSPVADGTKVTVVTDLTVTGKVAQFGRGVLADVSSKLIGQFVEALEADLESSGPASPAAAGSSTESPTTEAPAAAESENGGSGSANGSAPATAGPRRIESREAEPVDLLAVAGGSTVKRLAPVASVVAVIIVVLLRRRAARASKLARVASRVIPS